MNPNLSNISQEDFELIERFCYGTMDKNEIVRFEDRIKNDSSLSKQVKEHQILSQAIEEQSLKSKLEDFHNESFSKVIKLDSNKSKNKVALYKKLAIAASLILIIGIGEFMLYNQPSNNQKVFATYFKPDPGLATTMSTNTQFDFYDAMVDYKQGNYSKAIKKWESIQNNNPKSDSLNYFIGVAHLANGNEKTAIDFLMHVTKNNSSVFNNDATFYLGMAYLKTNNVALAKKYLTFSDTKISKQIIADIEN